MNKATPWLIILVLMGGAAAWVMFKPVEPEQHPSVIALPDPEPVAEPATPVAEYPVEPVEVEPEAFVPPLPSLTSSDEEVSGALARMLGAEAMGQVFVFEQMINRMVATIDSLDSAQVAPVVMPLTPPGGELLVVEGETFGIHADNAARYAPYMRLLDALDVDLAFGFYQRYYPLFQESWELLGYQDIYFNDRLVQVIDHLLETPQADGPVKLIKPEAVYLFEDERLEALSAGQKLLIRVGADHSEKIRHALTEFRARATQTILSGSEN